MCGIFGVNIQEKPEQVRKELFTIFKNQISRGTEGFGYALWREGKPVLRVRGEKDDVLFKDETFVQELKVGDYLLLHNRFPTSTPNIDFTNHPICGCGKVFIVHNGGISNDGALRKELEAKGHFFETSMESVNMLSVKDAMGNSKLYSGEATHRFNDSEVLAHLIEDNDIEQLKQAQGSYALAWMLKAGGCIYLLRHHNPLEVFKSGKNVFFASEKPREGFEEVVSFKEGEYGMIKDGKYACIKEGEKPVASLSYYSSLGGYGMSASPTYGCRGAAYYERPSFMPKEDTKIVGSDEEAFANKFMEKILRKYVSGKKKDKYYVIMNAEKFLKRTYNFFQDCLEEDDEKLYEKPFTNPFACVLCDAPAQETCMSCGGMFCGSCVVLDDAMNPSCPECATKTLERMEE